jgi:NTE family protein
MNHSPPTLRAWLQAEPFTLTLSAGFFSFFAHCGMLSVLEAEGLRPQRLTGSSAGALTAACWASGRTTAELKAFIFGLTQQNFWDPGPGLGFLKGRSFQRLIAQCSATERLEDCQPPVAVSVFDALTRQTHVLTQGDLAQVVYASCAMPIIWQPTFINGRLYWDGGLKDRHGLAGTQPGERIFYHHIASRSPWRRADSPSLKVPQRANLTALVIKNLPRSGPRKLAQGRRAFELARQATQEALDQVLHHSTVYQWAQ